MDAAPISDCCAESYVSYSEAIHILYRDNIFCMEDAKTCVYFFNTILPQRLNAIKIIQVGPTTPDKILAIMAVIQESSHMMKELREIRIQRTADAALPGIWQALNRRFQDLEVTSHLTDRHDGESCCIK